MKSINSIYQDTGCYPAFCNISILIMVNSWEIIISPAKTMALLTLFPVESPCGYGVGCLPVDTAMGQRHGDLDWPVNRKFFPIG